MAIAETYFLNGLDLAYLTIETDAATRLIADFATPDDIVAVARHSRKHRRRQGLAARALLRAMLLSATGRAWRLIKREDGRIEAQSPVPGRPAPRISLSHSGELVACALSTDGSVGIDVEQLRSDRDCVALAEAAFSSSEIAAVRESGWAAFYRIWTLREALFKAAGTADIADGEAPNLATADVWRIGTDCYELGYWPLDIGYGLAVARRRPQGGGIGDLPPRSRLDCW